MCVDTDAAIQTHGQTSHTLTPEGPLRIHTVAVHTDPWSLTLINVDTKAPGWVEQIAMFTNTFKASLVVDAHPIQTHVPDQTLIHVLTVLPVSRDLKAGVADTVEAPLSVHTPSVVTDTTVCHTLIQVSALGPGSSRLEASRTLAEVGSSRVHTLSVHTRVPRTLIIIDTLSS